MLQDSHCSRSPQTKSFTGVRSDPIAAVSRPQRTSLSRPTDPAWSIAIATKAPTRATCSATPRRAGPSSCAPSTSGGSSTAASSNTGTNSTPSMCSSRSAPSSGLQHQAGLHDSVCASTHREGGSCWLGCVEQSANRRRPPCRRLTMPIRNDKQDHRSTAASGPIAPIRPTGQRCSRARGAATRKKNPGKRAKHGGS